jgi:hypothetical protein
MTTFESRAAHGRGEQWNARDTRVYIGSSLHEDKTLRHVCVSCIVIHWVENPYTPPFMG